MFRCLLMGGCHVIVTTSQATRARWEMYREMYEVRKTKFCTNLETITIHLGSRLHCTFWFLQKYGGKNGKLTVVPFNGASVQDVDALVASLYDAKVCGKTNLLHSRRCTQFKA